MPAVTDPMPRLEVGIDCRDPATLAHFWSVALGYRIGDGDGDPYLDLLPPEATDAPVVFLQRVPEAKQTKNRLHLDLYVDEPEATVERLENLGADRIGDVVRDIDGSFSFQVMADPVGNEFCVCVEEP